MVIDIVAVDDTTTTIIKHITKNHEVDLVINDN